MSRKRFAIALKRSVDITPPADWHQNLASMEGVVMLGSTRNQAQFFADDNTAQRVRDELGEQFHVEEVLERTPS